MNSSELEESIELNQPKSCEWVDREPIYIKFIRGIKIDQSEWEGDKGAFFRYRETPCRLAADAGHKFCPRHEMEAGALKTTLPT